MSQPAPLAPRHPPPAIRILSLSKDAIRYGLPLLLALLPFLFFWRLFAPNALDRMWLPDGDLTLQYFPLRIFAANEIAAGRLPLWNPHMYAGQPGLADSQMAVLYPINLLTAIVLGLLRQPFTFAIFQLQIVLHYSLAALFTYGFALRLTGRRFAAVVAALVFTFGGYLISYPAQQTAILESAIWLPLVLWCLDWAAVQADLRRRAAGIACAGAAMALSILAGHPQTFIYVFYAAAGFWMWRSWGTGAGGRGQGAGAGGQGPGARYETEIPSNAENANVQHPPLHILSLSKDAPRPSPLAIRILSLSKDASRNSQFASHPIVHLALFALIALGLSAAQLLPTLEFTRYSTRAQLGYNFTSGGFTLHEIITLIIPGYFGGMPLYVGIIPLLLAALAILASSYAARNSQFAIPPSPLAPSSGPRPPAPFFLLLALLALFLSLGDSSFLYSIFYLLAPGFSQIRDQERAALLWSFALAMLAALGATPFGGPLSRRLRAAQRPIGRVLGGLLLAAIALIALAYLGALASEDAEVNLFPGILRQLVPGFFWLLAAWLLWRLRVYSTTPRRWLLWAGVALIGFNLFSVNGSYNFQKPTPADYFPATPLTRALQAELRTNPLARVASEGLLPGAHNAGAEYGFADINGNDPLRLAATEQFDRDVQELRRFQLLGVQYIVTTRTITHGAFTLLASEGESHLYHFSGALPRAWLVHALRVAPAAQQTAALNDPVFDPASEVLFLPADAPPAFQATSAPAGDEVSITQHAPGRLAIRTRSAAAGVLVISEILYPGWRATLDGRPATLRPADGILMAVEVPAGEHNLELTFAPELFTIGAVISGLSVALCLAILGLARFR